MAVLLAGRDWQPVQKAALEQGLLTGRRNLIVSAPTNAGKSLVGDLALLDSVLRGQRAVLLEPLRALAQEKYDDWTRLAPALGQAMKREFRVSLSTGDYRLEDERFTDAPQAGELVIATPEKLEALLRREEHRAWFSTLGAIVVDEAHLLSDPRRGPTLELLLGQLRQRKIDETTPPPRLVLLSGTVGDTAAAQEWLAPCDVVRVTERPTPLTTGVLSVPAGQSADEVILPWLDQQLQVPEHQILVFVYRTTDSQKLADQLSSRYGEHQAAAYHAQMPRAQRLAVKEAFQRGETRIIVTTTALAMGLNLPCTHVLIRDNTFPQVGPVPLTSLLQMLGRAGRGTTPGTGVVLVKPTDHWTAAELPAALAKPTFPDLVSPFAHLDPADRVPTASLVATLLNMREEASATELHDWLAHSLGGRALAGQVRPALHWLQRHKLAYQSDPEQSPDASYGLTLLGQRAVRAVLPLPFAAGYAQLLRDLMQSDVRDEILEHWQPMDTLLLLNLMSDRSRSLGFRWSEKLAKNVDSWCEQHPAAAPALAGYIRGAASASQAEELLGSLNVELSRGKKQADDARKKAYLGLARAAVLLERSRGRAISDIERRWGISNLSGTEESWRDELLWLLGGLIPLLDVKCYYYHLKTNLQADEVRIERVKNALKRQERQAYALMAALKHCSPLGTLLTDVRSAQFSNKPKIGIASIRKLEEAGFTDLAQLATMQSEDFQRYGLRKDFAQQLLMYFKQRRNT